MTLLLSLLILFPIVFVNIQERPNDEVFKISFLSVLCWFINDLSNLWVLTIVLFEEIFDNLSDLNSLLLLRRRRNTIGLVKDQVDNYPRVRS